MNIYALYICPITFFADIFLFQIYQIYFKEIEAAQTNALTSSVQL